MQMRYNLMRNCFTLRKSTTKCLWTDNMPITHFIIFIIAPCFGSTLYNVNTMVAYIDIVRIAYK